MKNIDGEKLWAYLDAKFSEFGEKYDEQSENVRNADDLVFALCRMQCETEKRNFIIELKNKTLSGSLDA